MTDTTQSTDRSGTVTGPEPEIPAEYDLPPDADPSVCAHCGAPFADEELLALHRGIDHPDALDESERDAFEAAYESEQERLRLFRLKALGALVLLYFGLLITYSVFA
ncbi:C2H2-type zinc finger protein [Halorientalis pallida]|uniref:C2H2-type zinc finger protein n=1 Tax=Halorientalis pallida TaxID=2479928 RepID=UPI003C701787